MWTTWEERWADVSDDDTVKRSAVSRDRDVLGDRYKLSAPCPGAGPGRFYRGRETASGKDVAVRVLPLRARPTQSALSAAHQAIRRCATSPHPHITRTYEIEHRDDSLIVVTEPRSTGLSDMWQTRHPELSTALTIGRQLCGALAYIHAHRETYGVLAPGSIELTTRGTARLSDVGLAPLTDCLRDPLPAEFFTDPSYLAPEQERGDTPDSATDVYHLGILLWKLVHNALPADAGDESLPPLLRDVLVRCISAKISDRPMDLIAVSDSLRLAQRQILGMAPSHAMERVQIMRRRTLPLEAAETQQNLPALPPASGIDLALPDWSLSSPNWAASSQGLFALEARLTRQTPSQEEDLDLTTYQPAIATEPSSDISLLGTNPLLEGSTLPGKAREPAQDEESSVARSPAPGKEWLRRFWSGMLARLRGGSDRRKLVLIGLALALLVALVAIAYGAGFFA